MFPEHPKSVQADIHHITQPLHGLAHAVLRRSCASRFLVSKGLGGFLQEVCLFLENADLAEKSFILSCRPAMLCRDYLRVPVRVHSLLKINMPTTRSSAVRRRESPLVRAIRMASLRSPPVLPVHMVHHLAPHHVIIGAAPNRERSNFFNMLAHAARHSPMAPAMKGQNDRAYACPTLQRTYRACWRRLACHCATETLAARPTGAGRAIPS